MPSARLRGEVPAYNRATHIVSRGSPLLKLLLPSLPYEEECQSN